MTKAQHLKAHRAAIKSARTRARDIRKANVIRKSKHERLLNGLGNVRGTGTKKKPPVSGLKGSVNAPGAKKPRVIREPKHRKATGAVMGGWITAGNDVIPCCAAVAVANSLLDATGWRCSDEAVLALHLAAAPGPCEGPTLEHILTVLGSEGLAGIRPSWIEEVMPGDDSIQPERVIQPGMVAGLTVPGWEPHAVAVTEQGVISWGAPLDGVLGYADEVWQLSW